MDTNAHAKSIVNGAYKALVNELKSGDTYEYGGSYDRPNKTSVKTMKARILFIEKIHELLVSKEISIEVANKATNEFGRKTTKLFWCKN